jgi:hypothetical protein
VLSVFLVTSAADATIDVAHARSITEQKTRAIEYLHASGAAAVWIKSSATQEFCTIHTGKSSGLSDDLAARWWTAAADAPRVASAARLCAGANPDVPAAISSLARSAAALGATLTPDDIAISRASGAVVRLDAMLESIRRDGTLQEFNARYKAGRAAAIAEGKGYMGFGIAMAQFKKALIPLLMNRPPEPGRMRSIFEDVFR